MRTLSKWWRYRNIRRQSCKRRWCKCNHKWQYRRNSPWKTTLIFNASIPRAKTWAQATACGQWLPAVEAWGLGSSAASASFASTRSISLFNVMQCCLDCGSDMEKDVVKNMKWAICCCLEPFFASLSSSSIPSLLSKRCYTHNHAGTDEKQLSVNSNVNYCDLTDQTLTHRDLTEYLQTKSIFPYNSK